MVCVLCKVSDKRILAVHHKDNNRKNNKVENLVWLCHNCHILVHHFGEDL
jgi:predicted HNH restriction endonuclease